MKMTSLTTLLVLLTAVSSTLAASCTISKYNEDDIRTAANECSEIILNGIEIPAGVTLDLNLNPGTRLVFQGTITWGFYEWNGPLFNLTGTDLEITGEPDHVLDVKGNLWWDGWGEHGGTTKPLFFVLHGVNNSVFHGITVRNTPWHAIWIEHSDGVVVYDVLVDNKAGDTQGGHNTDGFNVFTSNNVSFKNVQVYNQDDCIAVKSGTNVVIKDIYCYSGHGLSIGSVGGRDYNIVENVWVENVTLENSDNGIRIKTVYEATGHVSNITYKNISLKDINYYGIRVEGDYDINTGEPTGIATDGVPITGLTLENVTGTVKETGVNIYILVKKASDWHWSGIDVTGGKDATDCEGIPEGSDISC